MGEFNNTRKNHARAMESMSASLEAEQKAKGEALRVKKALEGEINELEIGLDHANKANSEGLKSIKRYQAQLKETIQAYEDEARSRSQIMEQVGISERKAAALSGELEESKALMDSSERAKRQLEMEIADGRNAVNNMQVINGRDMTAKRGLEGAIHTIQAEVDAMLGAAKNAEEKSKKAMVDAARLADELRAEQDHASTQASSKQSLNNQFGQLEARLADAENAAARGGKAAMAKLENKVHELEAELAGTQARTGEAAKAYQRAERKCKELAFTAGEDKKNQDRMTDLASKLQSKIKVYKQQIEEAEEIAALNLAKFRKAQQELEEARSAPSLPPSSKPCQIQGQDDQLKLEENLPSWKLQPLNPICEDPEVGQTLSELLLCFPKPFLSPLIFSSNPIWFSGTLISVSSPTININH